ncbi:hypothetical protein HQN90_25970 [Paenibacillus alba]|uniref:hypothetical protein n=1 Tax=Paenibacillus alba TaxID=1197127 RepID=UPI001567C15E|nr:hypothetical protein [Paenibacillus alba]NQX69585.1 hypothetical protein [Paenibacillus alba]
MPVATFTALCRDIGREDQAGTYRVYHYDRRGSTIALTDNSGQVTDQYAYAPYGEAILEQGDTPNPFR